VSAVFAAKGVAAEDASALAALYKRYPALMADFLVRHRLGLAHPDDENPAITGLATFAAFLVFGAIPLAPYFAMALGVGVAVHQLDDRHGRHVAEAEAGPQHARIAAGALRIAGAEHVEELLDGIGFLADLGDGRGGGRADRRACRA
jgi:hypothetical protein